MTNQEAADRVAECCEKIMDTMNDAHATRYIAIHALGAAACQVLSQIETEEAALDLFREMVEVIGKTMGAASSTRKWSAQPANTTH